MSIADDLQKLAELCRQGTLSTEEFEVAKQQVLSGSQRADEADSLATIMAQNEVSQLDREWELKRENYTVFGRYGRRYRPSKAMSVLAGVVVIAFGTLWTLMAASVTQSMAGLSGAGGFRFFPLFGVFFIVLGAAASAWAFKKASQYETAQADYERRRRDLLTRQQGT